MGITSAKFLGTTLLGMLTAAVAARAQGPLQPPAALLAWWPMDGNADDIGPLALHGALAQAGGTFAAGHVLDGFRPTAPDGHIAVPDAPELRFRSHFTFEAWVRVDSLATGPTYFVNKGTGDRRATPYTFGVIGTNGIVTGTSVIGGPAAPGRPFVTLSNGTMDRVVISNRTLTSGAFAHVAFTVTSTLCTIYVDGASRGSSSSSILPFEGAQALRLGGIVGGSAVNGVLDEVTCYTRALSAAEIQAIFAAGPRGKLKPVVDRTPPVVTIEEPLPRAVVGSRALAVRASVVDISSTRVQSIPEGLSVDLPAGGGIATGTVTLLRPDGPQDVTVTATDAANNTAATSVTVMLDTTAPIVVVVSPAEGAVFGTAPAAFAITVDDLTATSVQVGGQSVTLPPGQNTVAIDVPLAEGSNAVDVTVTDAAGNATVVVRTVVLDLSTPIVGIDSPPDGALFGAGETEVAVTTRVDDLSVTTVSSTPTGVAGTLPAGGGLLSGLVPLHEGLNQIAVRATDEAGRHSEAMVTVNLDSTPPGVTFGSPAAGSLLRGIVNVQVGAADVAPGSGIARIEVFAGSTLLASAEGAVCRFDLDTATLPDGNPMLRAVASDGAGNAGTATVTLTVDNTPPVVRVLEPLAGTVVRGTVAFVAIASDAGSGVAAVQQRVDGRAPTGDGSAAFEVAVPSCQVTGSEDTLQSPNGPLLFEVEATDAAGNTTLVEVGVEVQNQHIEGPGLRPRDGASVRGIVRIQITSERTDIIDLELQVDGQRIALGPGRSLGAFYDTTSRMDGPMVVRALVRTSIGTAETVHTVRVQNLRLLTLSPHVLSLEDRSQREVWAIVSGPAEALRRMLEQQLQLRVPGGNAVPMRSFTSLPGGRCALGFDRAALVAALLAARATGRIPQAGIVRVQLCAEDLVIGRARLVICPEGHRGAR
jgi:hypothetical protein